MNRCITCKHPSRLSILKLTCQSAERGKNRHGLTFLEALRQLGRWTPQEFEGLVGLWLEQSRKSESPTRSRARFH